VIQLFPDWPKYTKGSWATFLNRPSNVDIDKKFIVFSVRDMEDELKTSRNVYNYALHLECNTQESEKTIVGDR